MDEYMSFSYDNNNSLLKKKEVTLKRIISLRLQREKAQMRHVCV